MTEQQACLLRAMMRAKWPEDYDVKPTLRIVGGTDQKHAPARTVEPTSNYETGATQN